MSVASLTLRRGRLGEFGRVAAFIRRDFLMAWSYRTAFLADTIAIFGQALIFSFVGRLVDPAAMPQIGGRTVDYLSYVTTGIALAGFLQVGLSRLMGVIATERFMGTLEAVLLTPTRLPVLQIGWVAFDVLYVPLRTVVYFAVMSVIFGVAFDLSGALPALAFIVVFLPFVWGVGLVCAAITMAFRNGGALNGAVRYVLTFGSGAYFPVDLFPTWMHGALRANPVTIAVDGTREALLGGVAWAQVASDLLVLAACGLASLVIGSNVFAYAFRRELRRGAIGLY